MARDPLPPVHVEPMAGRARLVRALRASRPPKPPHYTATNYKYMHRGWLQWLADVHNIGEAFELDNAQLAEFIRECQQ